MNEKRRDNKWPIIGNEHITDYLDRILEKRNLSGSYIFLGPTDLGKTTVARFFAGHILCESEQKEGGSLCGQCPSCKQMNADKNGKGEEGGFEAVHSDLHIVEKDPAKRNISIEQVRGFIRSLGMSSFLNSYKIGIIKNAESLSIEAANALLKTMEEPSGKVVIILIASYLDNIPETIVSRSQVLNFRPVNYGELYDYLLKEYGTDRGSAKNLSHLSLGRPALAKKFFEDKDFYEDYIFRAQVFLDIFGNSINSGFNRIEEMIGGRATGQESAGSVLDALECWTGIVRDLALLRSGNQKFIQHEIFSDNLEKLNQKLDYVDLVNFHDLLQKGKERVRANVNPGLVLEDIVCGVKG
ncbi:MAG: ATP-binding protein [Patescibacteria group bacterium]